MFTRNIFVWHLHIIDQLYLIAVVLVVPNPKQTSTSQYDGGTVFITDTSINMRTVHTFVKPATAMEKKWQSLQS
jgi:hypothetical protein